MTREEAINKWIIPTISSRFNGNRCEEILEALEQEPVLDKIRAEIEEESYLSYDDNPRHIIDESWVIEIINKYKAEVRDKVRALPPVTPQPKTGHRKLTNPEWIGFLSEQFDISRTSAKEMLHAMMSVKKEDNFKKQFSQGNKDFSQGFSQGRKRG